MAVTLHTYIKKEYKNAPDHKTTPLNASNLNNSEDGIENAYTDIAAVYSEQTTEDAKRALKSDLTSISETGATASQAISVGTYFYLNGTLVRAKTAIANGATFTENTNYEVISAGALNNLGRTVKQVISLTQVATAQGYVNVDVSSYGIDSTKSYAWISGKTGNYASYVAVLTNTQLRIRSEGAQTVYIMILELN